MPPRPTTSATGQGLLTAIATEGYDGLAAATAATWDETASFLEVGVAYVRYAVAHPGPLRRHVPAGSRRIPRIPELVRASAASAAMLYGPVGSVAAVDGDDAARRIAGTAAWALVHGIATLWLQGSLRGGPIDDPEALTRAAAAAPLRADGRLRTPSATQSIQTRSWLSGSSIGDEMNRTCGASSNWPPCGVFAGMTQTSPFLTGRVTPPTVTSPVPSRT